MDSNSGVTYACPCREWTGPWYRLLPRTNLSPENSPGRCPKCEQYIYEDMVVEVVEKPSLIQHYEAREREMRSRPIGLAPTGEDDNFAVAIPEDIFNGGSVVPVTRDDPRLGSTQNVLRSLTEDSDERKGVPITTGVIDYFPLALAEVARLSQAGNDKHNPGQPLHWARGKSSDHADCLVRHLIQRGTIDTDGISHTAKVAWRALALLQEEMEALQGFNP